MKKLILAAAMFFALAGCALAGTAVTQGPTNFTGNCSVNGTMSTTGYGGNSYFNATGGDFCVGCAKGATLTNKFTVTSSTGPDYNWPPVPLVASPNPGDVEFYNNTPFIATLSNGRGVIPSQQTMMLASSYTLTSQTSNQAIFNLGTSSTGTVAVAASTTYYFEAMFTLSSMSATSGAFGFNLALPSGATYSYTAIASKTTGNTAGAASITYATGSSTALTALGTGTSGVAFIKGIIRVSTTAGTVTPQTNLSTAAAAVVGANSYFIIYPANTNTTTTIGNIV